MRPHTNTAATQVPCLNSDGTVPSWIAIIQTSPAVIAAPIAMNDGRADPEVDLGLTLLMRELAGLLYERFPCIDSPGGVTG
jgi:hypothetical protein